MRLTYYFAACVFLALIGGMLLLSRETTTIGLVLLLVQALLVYFVPLAVAVRRKSGNTLAIGLLNLLLGWTILGWVAALIWACLKGEAVEVQETVVAPPSTRPCPFCAEQIQRAAIKCRHCGSDVPISILSAPQAVSQPREMPAWLTEPTGGGNKAN